MEIGKEELFAMKLHGFVDFMDKFKTMYPHDKFPAELYAVWFTEEERADMLTPYGSPMGNLMEKSNGI